MLQQQWDSAKKRINNLEMIGENNNAAKELHYKTQIAKTTQPSVQVQCRLQKCSPTTSLSIRSLDTPFCPQEHFISVNSTLANPFLYSYLGAALHVLAFIIILCNFGHWLIHSLQQTDCSCFTASLIAVNCRRKFRGPSWRLNSILSFWILEYWRLFKKSEFHFLTFPWFSILQCWHCSKR